MRTRRTARPPGMARSVLQCSRGGRTVSARLGSSNAPSVSVGRERSAGCSLYGRRTMPTRRGLRRRVRSLSGEGTSNSSVSSNDGAFVDSRDHDAREQNEHPFGWNARRAHRRPSAVELVAVAPYPLFRRADHGVTCANGFEVFVDRRAVSHHEPRHEAEDDIVNLTVFRDAERRCVAGRGGDQLVCPASAKWELLIRDAADQPLVRHNVAELVGDCGAAVGLSRACLAIDLRKYLDFRDRLLPRRILADVHDELEELRWRRPVGRFARDGVLHGKRCADDHHRRDQNDEQSGEHHDIANHGASNSSGGCLVARAATSSASNMTRVTNANGAPAYACPPRCMATANICDNRIGAVIIAIPCKLPSAPCSLPCSLSLAFRDAIAMSDGDVSPPSEAIGMLMRNSVPVYASAMTIALSAPSESPSRSAFRSPMRFTIGPIRNADVIIEPTPKSASVRPS